MPLAGLFYLKRKRLTIQEEKQRARRLAKQEARELKRRGMTAEALAGIDYAALADAQPSAAAAAEAVLAAMRATLASRGSTTESMPAHAAVDAAVEVAAAVVPPVSGRHITSSGGCGGGCVAFERAVTATAGVQVPAAAAEVGLCTLNPPHPS